MGTLQKCKFLATHCAAAAESPTRSPVIYIRRRKTLRMLFNRPSSDRCRDNLSEMRKISRNSPDSSDLTRKKEKVRKRHKLGELFVSSSPPFEERDTEELLPAIGNSVVPPARSMISSNGSMIRPVSSAFRYRLLHRKAWRPVLVTIPEQ